MAPTPPPTRFDVPPPGSSGSPGWAPDPPPRPPPSAPAAPRRSRKPLYLGCGSLATLSCCACMVFAVIKGQQNVSEFGPLEQACAGQPVQGTAPYPAAAPRVVAMQHEPDGRWTYDGLSAPRDHEAGTRAETSVVLCLEEEIEVEDESCSFMTITTQVNHYRRSHRSVQARIVEASTGRALHAGEIRGETPPCTTGSFVPDEGYEFEGASVGRDEIAAFYAAWLASRAP